MKRAVLPAAAHTLVRASSLRLPSHGEPEQEKPSSTAGRRADPNSPDLLATVAHDLRAPLTTLAAATDLLATDLDALDVEDLRRIVNTIHRGTRALQGLIDNLLCAATIKSGRLPMRREALSLLSVVNDVEPIINPLLLHKAQSLHLESSAVVPPVLADRRRLGQVLVNLLGNASKFGPPSQPIDLMMAVRDEYVRVSVADRGPGIPPGRVEELFEPFARGQAAEAETEGVGLGLAIVRAIILAHGGQVGASNRPGGGACFWIELPAESAHRTTAIQPLST